MKFFVVGLLLMSNALHAWAAEEATAAKDAKEVKEVKDPKDAETTDADITQILNSVGYPELQVVPRASERLAMEAKWERSFWWLQHWPIQMSGLITAYVGSNHKNNFRTNLDERSKTNGNNIAMLTQAVGLGWVVGGLVLGVTRPYVTASHNIQKYKGKDERSELMRERLAEEAMERPARTMRILQHASVVTNFTMNALVLDYGNDKAKLIAGLGAIFSFLPYVFEDNQIEVWEKHLEYKKKIYAPLKTGTSVGFVPQTKEIYPVATATWTF